MSTRIFGVAEHWLGLGLPAVLGSLILSGCSTNEPYRINLMPAPDVYEDAGINPFAAGSEDDKVSTATYYGILYATNREPATDDDKED